MAGLLDYQRIPNDAEGGSYMHRAISQSTDEDLQQALQMSLAQALASGGKWFHPFSTFPQSARYQVDSSLQRLFDAAAAPGSARDMGRITEGLAKLGYTLRRISSLGRSSKALQVAPNAASAAVLPPIRAAADGPPSSIPSDSAGSAL